MILINKPQGLTPLEVIQIFKDKYSSFKNKKLSYAGRLDPMAQGLLIILEGDENKNRRMYESYDKTYEFSILFGVSTDTYDLLGKITEVYKNPNTKIRNSKQIQMTKKQKVSDSEFRISNLLPTFLGKRMQPYPPYSSKTAKGKPLYWWARKNRLSEIVIPKKEVTISRLELKRLYSKPVKDIKLEIFNKLSLIHGNFRQEEIKKGWKIFFKETKEKSFFLADFTITCSSGTYVRALVNEIGEELDSTTTTFSINRIKIGEFMIEDSIKVD